MDRMNQYHAAVGQLIWQYATEWQPRDGTRLEAVTDGEHGHYLIVRFGWKEGRFVHACLVHFTIRGREVHLLKNDTEIEWDRELIDRGIAPEDIVLAFRQTADQQAAST